MKNNSFFVSIDLFKKPRYIINPKIKFPFYAFGYFDGVDFGLKTNLKELYTSNYTERDISHVQCERQSLHLCNRNEDFSFEDYKNLVSKECRSSSDNIIVISELELQKHPTNSGEKLMNYERIAQKIKNSLPINKDGNINYCLLDSLDHADYVLIIRGSKLEELNQQILGLRQLQMSETKITTSLLKSTYSTTLFPEQYQPEMEDKEDGGSFDVSIRVSSGDQCPDNVLYDYLCEIGRKYVNESDKYCKKVSECNERVIVRNVFGKYDYDLLVRNISQSKVFELRKEIFSSELNIIASNVRWFNHFNCNTHELQSNQVLDQNEEYANAIKIVEKLNNALEQSSSIHTNEWQELIPLISKFEWMVQERAVEVRIVEKIGQLIQALTISDWADFTGKASVLISKYIDQQNQACRSIFERPTDNTLFGGSLAKLQQFYSTIINEIEKSYFQNNSKDKWFHFLLIDHKPTAHSYLYKFLPKPGLDFANNNVLNNLIVVTMGIGLIGNFKESIPLLFHEMGHYLPLNHSLIQKENSLLEEIISSIIASHLIGSVFTDYLPTIFNLEGFEKDIQNFLMAIKDVFLNFLLGKLEGFKKHTEGIFDKRFDLDSVTIISDICLSLISGQFDDVFGDDLILTIASEGRVKSGWLKALLLKRDLLEEIYGIEFENKLGDQMIDLINNYQADYHLSQQNFEEKIIDNLKSIKDDETKKKLGRKIAEYVNLIVIERNATSSLFTEVNDMIVEVISKYLKILDSRDINRKENFNENKFIFYDTVLPMVKFNSASKMIHRENALLDDFVKNLVSKIKVDVNRWSDITIEVISDYFMACSIGLDVEEYSEFVQNKIKDEIENVETVSARKLITMEALHRIKSPEENGDRTDNGNSSIIIKLAEDFYNHYILLVTTDYLNNHFRGYLEKANHNLVTLNNILSEWNSNNRNRLENNDWMSQNELDLKLLEEVIDLER